MYLSKLMLNQRHRQVRKDIANPYDMHATLTWGASEASSKRSLWRLEHGRQGAILLHQSQSEPNWQALLERHPGYATLDVATPKPFKPTLKVGQVLRFRLKANPTVTRFDPDSGKGKRRGLAGIEAQLVWLERQGDRHGYELVGAMVTSTERVRALKRKQGNEERVITLQGVTYDGHLRVTDPDPFLSALQGGVGRAKALGFGLLSVGPAR